MRNDYDSDIWGRKGWFFIDTSVLSYPENPSNEIKENYYLFFKSFKYILPCAKCRNHYEIFLNNNPLTNEILSSKNNLIKWVLKLHNNVNIINNKKEISYDDFIKYYDNRYSKNCNVKCSVDLNKIDNMTHDNMTHDNMTHDNMTYNKNILNILLLIIILVLIIIIHKISQNM